MKLKKVVIQASPPPPKKGEQPIWTSGADGKICWECLGIVLIRPKKSLKELKTTHGTWKIKPASPTKK